MYYTGICLERLSKSTIVSINYARCPVPLTSQTHHEQIFTIFFGLCGDGRKNYRDGWNELSFSVKANLIHH